MTSPRSLPRRIAGGLAAYLDAAGLASWDDYGAGPGYTAESPWPVFLGPDLPSSPDRILVITPGAHTYVGHNVEQAVQIRLRGDRPADGVDVAGAVAEQAQAIEDAFRPNGFPLAHVTLGDIRAGLVAVTNSLPLGPDGNGRPGLTLNLRVRVRPARG